MMKRVTNNLDYHTGLSLCKYYMRGCCARGLLVLTCTAKYIFNVRFVLYGITILDSLVPKESYIPDKTTVDTYSHFNTLCPDYIKVR